MQIKTLNYNIPPLSRRGQITQSNIDELCPLAIPNKIFFISMHVPSLVKIPWDLLKYSSGNENMGVSRTKFDEICPLAIPNQISTTSMHIPNLVKIHSDVYSSYHPETKIWLCLGQITLSKFDEICPLAIPNQSSTISMHIPSLVKIHWFLLKVSSGNEIRTDGQTHGRPTWNHNTPPL